MSEDKVSDNRILDDKYRPQTLDDLVGNEALIVGVKAALAKDARPHTWMFHGSRGSGKTTLSRILARELGAHPHDTYEYNISQMRGIDTARQIIDGLHMAPMFGKSKVIILNECHGGTKEFWECLLEVLELPPDHVYFILCTTEPEKLKSTIGDRAITGSFKVNPLTQAKSMQLLHKVIKAEGCNPQDFPVVVKQAIIARADGIPRNLVKLLDKVFDITDDAIAIELINDSIVETENAQVMSLITALKDRKPWVEVAGILKTLNEEPEGVRQAILTYFSKALLGSNGNEYFMDIISVYFADPYFSTKKAGLIASCYAACK